MVEIGKKSQKRKLTPRLPKISHIQSSLQKKLGPSSSHALNGRSLTFNSSWREKERRDQFQKSRRANFSRENSHIFNRQNLFFFGSQKESRVTRAFLKNDKDLVRKKQKTQKKKTVCEKLISPSKILQGSSPFFPARKWQNKIGILKKTYLSTSCSSFAPFC